MAKAGNTKRIARIIPALTARTQFGQILKRAGQNKERFVVERRGEPGVVIMSVEEYLRLFAEPVSEFETLRREAKAKGLDRLTLRDINREIKRYRRDRKKTKE